jgi:putative spermidine/putrescine transport system substrate-binding protein
MTGNKASGIGTIATGIVYNTKIFQEKGWAAPKSWHDLKDPKFKGKVLISPLTTGYGLHTFFMLTRLAGGNADNMDPGFAFMKKELAPNVVAFESSMAKISELFQTGEAWIGVWGTPRFQALASTGFPIAFVYPEEGAPVTLTAICPVAKPKISPKAHAFIALMLSAPAQKLLADTTGFAPVRLGVEVSDPGVMPIGPLAEKLVVHDWSVFNAKRDDWIKRWAREIEN